MSRRFPQAVTNTFPPMQPVARLGANRPPFTDVETDDLVWCLTEHPGDEYRHTWQRFGAMKDGAHKERAEMYTAIEFKKPMDTAKRRMNGLQTCGSLSVAKGGSAATAESKAARLAKLSSAVSYGGQKKKDDRLQKLVPPPPGQSPPRLQRLPQAAAPPAPAFTPGDGSAIDAIFMRHAGLSLLLNPLLFSSPHTFRTPVHPAHKTPRPIQPATRTQATSRQTSSR